MLPHTKDKAKKRPIGTIDRTYVRLVIGTCFLESSTVVNLARICVMTVAEARCHVVRKMAVLDYQSLV